MTTRGQILRSSTPGQAPVAGARQPGELWTTFPDLQLGVIDASKNAQRLIAVRFFSTTANYAAGDFVVQGGKLYFAKGAITAGAFNATQWTALADSASFMPIAGGAFTGPISAPAGSTIAGYLPLSGGTLTGKLTLSGPPTNALDAATKAYADSVSSGLYLPIAGGTMLGQMTLFADPTQVLHPASKQYVDRNNAVQNRNRLVNGDFSVNQYNSGSTLVSPANNGTYIADRWHMTTNLVGVVSSQRQGGPVAGGPAGVNYAMTLASLTAHAIAAGDFCTIRQGVEQTNIGDWQWGTANAAPVTLSFWAQASIAGTYSGALLNSNTTRSYPFSFALPANVWTLISITIPGDTAAGMWSAQNNASGLGVSFDLGTGATYRGPAGAWAAANYVGATGAASPIATNGATLSLSAVQLELGSVATPFDWKGYHSTLQACWRYHMKIAPQVTLGPIDACVVNGSGVAFTFPRFNPPMRAAPTVAVGGNLACWTTGGTSTGAVFASASSLSAVSGTISWTVTGQPAGAGVIRDNDGTGFIVYDAEIG